MERNFTTIEELIADEGFQAWYSGSNQLLAREWELWMLEHPHYLPLKEEALAWLAAHPLKEEDLPVEQVNAAYARLDKTISETKVVPMRRSIRWWIPAAAAVLLLIAAGFIFVSKNQTVRYNSLYGSISNYELPDGSHVILNANSNIRLGDTWESTGDREVWLDGEAFFKVQKNPSHNRFIVHTKGMDIIVTGTQFNAVNREDEVSVLLTEGSVILHTADGKDIPMKPGDYVRIEKSIPSKQNADQEKLLAWKQAKLDFDNTPMNEVAKIITRHYGVKVSLADTAVGERKISGVMPNDNLDDLIRALEATGEFRITKTESGITISAL